MNKLAWVLLLALVTGPLTAQQPNLEEFQGHTLAFIPNEGQITTDRGVVADQVQFRADVPGLEFYVTNSGISYVFVHHNRDEYDPALGGHPTPDFQQTMDFARVDMNLVGADIQKENAVLEVPDQGVYNYYYAHIPDGAVGVQAYRRLTYKNVYPNIDWVIYSDLSNALKYEFVIRPGGNPNDIRLEYKWADIVVSDNSIELSTPMGKITEQELFIYEKESGNQLPGKYTCQGGYVGIDVDVPPGKTVVIDPPLVWSTYYGGAGSEQCQTLVCSGNGEYVFVAGYSGSTTYPTMNPGGGAYFQGTLAGLTDAFVVKFDTSGVRFWSTYYGGTGSEGSTSYTGVSIACGAGTTLWMVGTTNSTNLPLQNGGGYYQGVNAGSNDFFVVKFDLNGVRQHCTYFGGTGIDGGTSHGCGASCDASGNFYFAGRTTSINFPLMNPGGGAYYDNTQNGADDLGVVKLSSANVLLWSTYLGGTGDDMNYSMDLHVDKVNSKLYVASCASSINLPCVNPGGSYYFDNTQNGLTDMYFARFSLGGVMEWATYVGGTGDEWLAMSVNSAPDGDIALITLTGSSNIPCVNPGGGAFFDNTVNGSWDIYVVRFESTGQMSWSTYYGSANNEHCQHNLTIDGNGNVIICGVSDGAAAPPTFNTGPPHFYNGVKDAQGTYCLVQFSPVGVMLWGTFWGGSGHDHLFGTVGKCIGVSAHSDIFLAAETSSPNLPMMNPGGGAYYNTAAGQGFVTKFNNDIITAPLPVELLFWTCGTVTDGIQLDWSTATEMNNNYFEIERTADGINWEVIAVIPGAGTSSTYHEYQFIDQFPLPGVNYYRLSQVDYDGTRKMYEPSACDYNSTGNVVMTVLNMAGQVVLSEETSDFRTAIENSSLDNGAYIIQLTSGLTTTNVKYVKASR